MPGSNKKRPLRNTRKKMTTLASARISTKKVKRKPTIDIDGSYIQDPETVSTVNLEQLGPSTLESAIYPYYRDKTKLIEI